MADGISKQEMSELFEKFFGVKPSTSIKFEAKDYDNFVKRMQASTKELKDSLPVSKQMSNTLKGMQQQYVDITDQLEEFDRAIKEAQESGEDLVAEQIIQAKHEKQKTAAIINTKAALNNLATGMFGILGSVIDASLDYAKSLQSGADGITTNTQAIVNEYKIAGEAAQTAGGMLSGLGSVASAFGGKWAKVGTAAVVVGEALGILGKKSSEYAGKAAQFLGDELSKTKKAYTEVTQTGAMLAGGMTELRSRAADAGLDVQQFATAIKSSTESLQMMGLGMGEGAKRIGSVSKELRNSQLGTQLQKLGYSFEEQAELTAQVMANNSAAGNKRALSDQEIAKQTADYGKSLKILQDITGEDAKKAMEKARMQAMEADMLAQAYEKGGPEAVKKLQAQLATMPEAMKKGYMEFVSTGGTAVADAATNVAITQNPKIMEQYRQQYQDLGNAAVDQKQALVNTGKYTEQTGKYAKDHMENTRVIGMAGRLTGDSLVQGAGAINNGLILAGTKLKEGATDAAEKATEGAAVNTAPLDQAVADLESETQRTKAALGKELTPAITEFAGQLRGMAKSVKETMDELGLKQKSTGEKVGGAVGEAAGGVAGGWAGAASGAAAGAALGSVVPVLGTAVGSIVGGLVGGLGGGYLGAKGGGGIGEWIGSKFAVGGMVDKPTRALIGEAGPEAIVPLPDGRTIPVTFGSSPLSGLGDMLKDIKLEVNDDNSITQLTQKIDQLVTTIGSTSAVASKAGGNDMIADAFNSMQDMLAKQLGVHEEMAVHAKDNKDLLDKLLKVSM